MAPEVADPLPIPASRRSHLRIPRWRSPTHLINHLGSRQAVAEQAPPITPEKSKKNPCHLQPGGNGKDTGKSHTPSPPLPAVAACVPTKAGGSADWLTAVHCSR